MDATTDDGISLHYEYADGPEEATPVVFLNGMTQSTQHWNSQVGRFEDQRPVLTYDARGQGQSELGEGTPTLDRHVADLAAILQEADLPEVHLAGFSHGSRIALAFAAEHPDRVARLVCCSATAEPTGLARTIVTSWQKTLDAGGLEAMTWSALPAILGSDYLEEHEAILEGIVRASLRRNSEEGVRALLEGMADYPPLEELAGRIDAPTLVLSADEDLLVEAEGARRLAEIAGGRHREIKGCGHTIPIEKPAKFHRRVAEFLSNG
jgi:3-oxoadipate enol-lactonase